MPKENPKAVHLFRSEMEGRLEKQSQEDVDHDPTRKFQAVRFPNIREEALGTWGLVGNAKVISSRNGRSDFVIDLVAVARGQRKVP
jgi:hypothetical protein